MPSKYTPEIMADLKSHILSYRAQGLSISGSCELARVPVRTFYDWCNQDQEFAQSIKEATAYCEQRHLQIVQNSGDPKFSRWFLSILKPEVYGEKKAVEMTVKQDDGTAGFSAMIEQTGGLFIESDPAEQTEKTEGE